MNIENLLGELYEMVDKAWNFPLTDGKAVFDSEAVKGILDETRDNLPQELRQAKTIVADRNQIISDAKREAEGIVRIAEERAKTLVNQDEIVRQAQQKANELVSQNQVKFHEMRRASDDYIDDLMKRMDDALAANLAELRKTRNNVKVSQRDNQQ